MGHQNFLKSLPYQKPFLFVDEILEINEVGVKGTYTFSENSDFYKGHFKDNPITPGVILTECCAQIGLVCLGVYLMQKATDFNLDDNNFQIGFSSSQMDFYKPVFPGEKVIVESKKIFFRFGKLKCGVKMYNTDRELLCKGELSGMLKVNKNA